MEAKFILSKKKVLQQYNKLRDLCKISYSFKTNREVAKILQDLTDSEFSIHLIDEINMFKDKRRIWFFSQAWNKQEIKQIIKGGVRNFVIDNEKDLEELLSSIEENKIRINLLLRMKFQEHRIGSGRYFVYGMPSSKINEIIRQIKDNQFIDKLGVHIHRKSQNVSEWEIKQELKDSLTDVTLKRINIINLGGGLPTKYKSYNAEVMPYILEKIKGVREFLQKQEIETYIEPGRFISAPSIKLETEIIQIYGNVIVIDTSIYNCALDTVINHTKMLVENELEDTKEGNYYLIKGNSPTRDDIFRYKTRLRDPKISQKLIFLNAGAYNYTTDFCGFKKLKTEIVEDF